MSLSLLKKRSFVEGWTNKLLEKRIKELNTAKQSNIIGLEEMMDSTMEVDFGSAEPEPVKKERPISKRIKIH